MKHWKRIVCFGVGILSVSTVSLLAQGPGPMRVPGGQMRGPAAERIEQFKKIRMMEVLRLDEETSIRFFARYNKHQGEMHEIEEQRRESVSKLRSLRQSNASNAELEKALAELKVLPDKVAQARERFLNDLWQILTVKQIADYIVFEENFVQNLRDIMRDMQRERMDRRF